MNGEQDLDELAGLVHDLTRAYEAYLAALAALAEWSREHPSEWPPPGTEDA